MRALVKIVLGGEDVAESGADSENVEEVAGDEFAIDTFRFAFEADAEREGAATEHPVEDLVVIADGLVHRVGNSVAAGVAAVDDSGPREEDQAFGIANGEVLQQDLINKGEDCGIGTNAEGKRDDGDKREYRRFTEGLEGEFQVAQ